MYKFAATSYKFKTDDGSDVSSEIKRVKFELIIFSKQDTNSIQLRL